MAANTKRKHGATEDGSSRKPAKSDTVIVDMKTLASVTKGFQIQNDTRKRKTFHPSEPTPPAEIVSEPTPARSDRKRKRNFGSFAEEQPRQPSHTATESQIGSFELFTEAKKTEFRTKRIKNARPVSPARTPSKGAAALFDKLKLNSEPSAIPFALGKKHPGYDTPPDTPDTEKYYTQIYLPRELQEFLQLHAAFMTSLSLYYAHNGTTSPVNVSTILPLVTNSWKKRSVTLDDIQKSLAVTRDMEESYTLIDCGRAGLCLSRTRPRGRILKRTASHIDEDELNQRFEESLQRSWLSWQTVVVGQNCNPSAFISQLPLVEIKKHESAEKAAPFFARGEQRLADLKAGQVASKTELMKASTTEIIPEQKTKRAVHNRGTNLLDRILAKQALTATIPVSPTKEQLERKAALHRVEDVVRVLDLLAAGKSRCSFSMPAMVQHLQQSLRNPISRDEVERCLELMDRDITPEYVNVVRHGTVKGVVITKAGKTGLEELKARLAKAGAYGNEKNETVTNVLPSEHDSWQSK